MKVLLCSKHGTPLEVSVFANFRTLNLQVLPKIYVAFCFNSLLYEKASVLDSVSGFH